MRYMTTGTCGAGRADEWREAAGAGGAGAAAPRGVHSSSFPQAGGPGWAAHAVELGRGHGVRGAQQLEEVVRPEVVADVAEHSDPHGGLRRGGGAGVGCLARAWQCASSQQVGASAVKRTPQPASHLDPVAAQQRLALVRLRPGVGAGAGAGRSARAQPTLAGPGGGSWCAGQALAAPPPHLLLHPAGGRRRQAASQALPTLLGSSSGSTTHGSAAATPTSV
jgi:hypothetical protein